MHSKNIAAIAAAVTIVTAGAAQAVTETFDFFYGPHSPTWEVSKSYTEGDLSLTVTASNASNAHVIDDSVAKVAQWRYHGLGVKSEDDGYGSPDHKVDAYGDNNVAIFSFNKTVKLESIRFSYVDRGDMFDLYLGDGGAYQGMFSADDFDGPTKYSLIDMSAGNYVSNVFGIGAAQYEQACEVVRYFGFGGNNECRDFKSAFKIKKITVSYDPSEVPLPAAGWMLLAGLGGIAAMKRRKKS